MCSVVHGGDDALGRQGQVAHADAHGVVNGIANGRSDGAGDPLANTQRLLLGVVDQLNLHLRYLTECEDGVTLPVAAGDAGGVVFDFFFQVLINVLIALFDLGFF